MDNESSMTAYRKQLHIFGGMTEESQYTNPRSEQIAHQIAELVPALMPHLDVQLHIANGSEGGSGISTDTDLQEQAREVAANLATKIVVWLPDTPQAQSIAGTFRKESVAGMAPRKDIFLVGMTATSGVNGSRQYTKGLDFVKKASANICLAYDYETENGMVVAPEETFYDESTDLNVVLRGLLEIANLRSQLTFTRSTVVGGEPVDWNSSLVYPTLREVVNYCIKGGAYKPFLGVTAGHFAVKINDNEFLTSRRRTNFNELATAGLVRVITDGPDRVMAYGSKPSVGGQSQRIVFAEHPERDSIVHFHCPIKPGSNVPTVSQRAYECGSHECGQNTSNGLAVVEDGIEAVYLDNHGPNIVFNHDENPVKISEFIADNFDLTRKTGGYQLAS